MTRFESLEIWQRSFRLSEEIFIALRKIRDYGFKDQITRAALSIPSNIAEGFERNSHKEFARFLRYAKGSAGELRTQLYLGILRTQLYLGIRVGYIEEGAGKKWLREAEEISRMIFALIQSSKNN